ncbi:MAG: putative toxin-antitoxin system toxin component, PIN family [Spirochaetales bacterium]|nr:putative toxin-antitoxin system toxin component, PIN family [Spirochaetales bacterium]
MEIVLDTNVLISGVINPDGKPARIINLLLNGKINILYDNRIIKEYLEALGREKFDFQAELIESLIDFIKVRESLLLQNL